MRDQNEIPRAHFDIIITTVALSSIQWLSPSLCRWTGTSYANRCCQNRKPGMRKSVTDDNDVSFKKSGARMFSIPLHPLKIHIATDRSSPVNTSSPSYTHLPVFCLPACLYSISERSQSFGNTTELYILRIFFYFPATKRCFLSSIASEEHNKTTTIIAEE